MFESIVTLTDFCGILDRCFEFSRKNVDGLRKALEGIGERFKKYIVRWTENWIQVSMRNSRWLVTADRLKRISEFAPGEITLPDEVFKELLSTKNFNKPEQAGVLLDAFFSRRSEEIPNEAKLIHIKTWLGEVKKKYWDKDLILENIFFPMTCPKFFNVLTQENLNDIYEEIKRVTTPHLNNNNNNNKTCFNPRLLLFFFKLELDVGCFLEIWYYNKIKE